MARILALTSRVPWPPREGHQLRSYHLLDALASRHEVHLLSCARRDDHPDERSPLRDKLAGFEAFPIPAEHSRAALAAALTRSLATATPFVAAKYAIHAIRQRVAARVETCDLIHVDMLPLIAQVTEIDAKVPIVLNAHNVEHALLEARIGTERRIGTRWFLRNQVSKLRAFEHSACVCATAVLACSDDDAAQLRQLAPAAQVQVVPNGVDLDYNQPTRVPPPNPAQMVFVGQMGWFPNRDGIEWFLAEVLPRILEKRNDARLLIVGKSDGLTIPNALHPHVELAGFVPDVRQPVHDAAVYVVPLRAGSGTRLKVLEAMALGKAIVTTRIGVEGIALEPGRDALFADDADSFAHAVLHLIDQPAHARQLGAAARMVAEQHYGWQAIGRAMLALYASLTLNGTTFCQVPRRIA